MPSNTLKRILPQRIKKLLRRILVPKVFYMLSSNTSPASYCHGFDRGKPIDRFYIENFIKENQQHIQGNCLELLNDNYTRLYGKNKVIKSDILDIDESNKNATIFDDLRRLNKITDNSYDCIILTQVLQFIDDVDSAISECYRILKKNGVLLVTLPSLSRIDPIADINGDYWRFTSASAKYLFQKHFKPENLSITTAGNVRSGILFYLGLSQEDVSKRVLEKDDHNFPLIITVKAVK